MSFGLRMWGADGKLQFDTDTVTWRVALSLVVSFDGSPPTTRQYSVPGCNPSNSTAFCLPLSNVVNTDLRSLQLEAQMGTDIVYVRNFLGGFSGSSTISWATMRLMVMRWK